jgi:hypothetical protein
MHKSRIVKLLKLAYKLDKSGNFRESDKITYKLTRIAQYYGNFMTTNTENRVVPFEDTEEDVEIDAKRLDKQDRFRVPESKDDEASNPEYFNIEAKNHGPSGGGITYEDPAPESKNIGLDDDVAHGDLSKYEFENTYEQNVANGLDYLNRNPR